MLYEKSLPRREPNPVFQIHDRYFIEQVSHPTLQIIANIDEWLLEIIFLKNVIRYVRITNILLL